MLHRPMAWLQEALRRSVGAVTEDLEAAQSMAASMQRQRDDAQRMNELCKAQVGEKRAGEKKEHCESRTPATTASTLTPPNSLYVATLPCANRCPSLAIRLGCTPLLR